MGVIPHAHRRPAAATPRPRPRMHRAQVSPPTVAPDASLQLLVTNVDYDEHKGRVAIGRVTSGTIRKGQPVRINVLGRRRPACSLVCCLVCCLVWCCLQCSMAALPFCERAYACVCLLEHRRQHTDRAPRSLARLSALPVHSPLPARSCRWWSAAAWSLAR